jgi:hypothetical protein
MRRSFNSESHRNEFEAWDEGTPYYFDERRAQTLRLSPDPSLSHFLQCAPGNSQTRFSGRWYKGSRHRPWRLSRCKKLRQKRCSAVTGFNEAT